MSEQEREQKTAKLAALKEEMKDVHGSKCEVFSRVCGYLRPVQNYNKGKREEFALRSKFDVCCCSK